MASFCAHSWVARAYLLGGFLFGALLALGMAARRHVRRRAEGDAQQQTGAGISVYLNVFLTNKDEVVRKTVLEKVPRGAFGIVQKLASKVAQKLVSNESMARKVGKRLADAVPRKLETKKLKADAACVFVQGGLAVVKINVTGIDILGLIARQMPDKRMRQVRSAYRCWNQCGTGGEGRHENEEEMPFHLLKQRAEIAFQGEVWAQIESQCLSSLGGQIEAKLWNDAGVEAIVVPKSSSTQAQFFYDLVETMNNNENNNSGNAAGAHRRRLTPGMKSALPLLMRERGPRTPSEMLDPDQLFVAASNFLSRAKNAETIYRRLRYREREGEIDSAIQICKLFAALHHRATSGGHAEDDSRTSGDGSDITSPSIRHALKLSIPEAKKRYVVMLGDLLPKWKKELAHLDPKNAGSHRQNQLLELSKQVEKRKKNDKQLHGAKAHSNASTNMQETHHHQRRRQQQPQPQPQPQPQTELQQQLLTKLPRPSPLSIFLQPLLFPRIQPLPIGRLHCRVVAAQGLGKSSRGLLSNSIHPCVAVSVGIPPEPHLSPQLLQGLAVNCGPTVAACAKRILARQWKKQQEETDTQLLDSRLALRLERSGHSDLTKLAHHNSPGENVDDTKDDYDVARGVTKSQHSSMLNPVWNSVDSTFVLPVQSTGPLSCLRIAVLEGNTRNHDAEGSREILCEAAVDLSKFFHTSSPSTESHGWCDAYIDLVAPNHAVAAVQPRENRGRNIDNGKAISGAGMQQKRPQSLMRRVGSMFSTSSSSSSSLSSSSSPISYNKPSNIENNIKDELQTGENVGKTSEPIAGTLHLRLRFETLASSLSKGLANQAALTRERQHRQILQKMLSRKRAAKEAEAAEAERLQMIQEERARIHKKKASLTNFLGSAVNVMSSAEQAAEELVLGGASLIHSDNQDIPRTAKNATKNSLEIIDQKMEWFVREWEHDLNAESCNLQGTAADDILLLTIYLATTNASSFTKKSDLLRRFSSLQLQHEWWQTCIIMVDLFEPLIRLGNYCLSMRVVFCAWLVLLNWIFFRSLTVKVGTALLEYSGLNVAIARLLEGFGSLVGEVYVESLTGVITVLFESANKYTILCAAAWIVVLRILCLRFFLRQRLATERLNSQQEMAGGNGESPRGFSTWGLLAKQGLEKSRRDLNDFLRFILKREGALAVANLADAGARNQAANILLNDSMRHFDSAMVMFQTRGTLSLIRKVGKSGFILPRLLGKSWRGDTVAASRLLLGFWTVLTMSIYCGAASLNFLVLGTVSYCLVRKTATCRAVEDVVWFWLHLLQCIRSTK